MKILTASAGIWLGLVALSNSQEPRVQTDLSICNWYRFRAGVIRDTVYLDGGQLTWQIGLSNGEPILSRAGKEFTNMYTLSFNSSFDKDTNFTGILRKIPKLAGGASSSITPIYYDGTMFYNDYTLLTYGGLTSKEKEPASNASLYGYNVYQYGPPKSAFQPGPILPTIHDNVTRYVTHGAGVSVPSDNKGYYFSGRQRGDNLEIDTLDLPNNTANSLVTVDLSRFGEQKFNKDKLPEEISGRANAELAWLPVSDGVLVAIGGVTNPEEIPIAPLSQREKEENAQKDPDFMKTVNLYDVGTGKWYSQDTQGPYPPASNSFCSVVAEASDRSSFNIYVYGGYNGTVRTTRPYDDVYVLSIPSFTWTKVYNGESNMGRRSHKCFKPYPDQMLVIGGEYSSPTACLVGPFVRVFNLNTLSFQDKYDPTKWAEYSVPDVITKKIGGNGKGGSTLNKPEKWGHNDLEGIFSRKYTKTIPQWYPFQPAKATESTSPSATPSPGGGQGASSGLPRWVGAVLGVVLGLIFITAVAVIWLILRRRRERRYAPSVAGTSEVARKRILGWMYGMGHHATHKPDMTTTSTEIGINDKHESTAIYSDSGIDSVVSPHQHSAIISHEKHAPEAGSSPIHEMHAGTVMSPSELPTDYNDNPIDARHFSDTPSFVSPISPAISPSPENQRETYHPTRPSHGRHGSSFSSAGIPASLDNAVLPEIAESRPRDRRVSGFTEEFSESYSPSQGDLEPGRKS